MFIHVGECFKGDFTLTRLKKDLVDIDHHHIFFRLSGFPSSRFAKSCKSCKLTKFSRLSRFFKFKADLVSFSSYMQPSRSESKTPLDDFAYSLGSGRTTWPYTGYSEASGVGIC